MKTGAHNSFLDAGMEFNEPLEPEVHYSNFKRIEQGIYQSIYKKSVTVQ